MAKLPVALTTAAAVRDYLRSPAAVVILNGAHGVGKRALADAITTDVLDISPEQLENYPYRIQVEPEGESIPIEAIRRVQSSLIRSVPGTKPIRRVIVIPDAQKLTTEAQNALLKSLEEPPRDTMVVLTVDNLHNLLPTVVSRAQTIPVLPISEKQATDYFGFSSKVTKVFHMAGGRASLMQALLDDDNHPLLNAIEAAKGVLLKPAYERLLLVNNLSKDRPASQELLDALLLLARVSLTNSVSSDKTEQARRWHAITKQVTTAQQAMSKNASTKLVLTDLFLHL